MNAGLDAYVRPVSYTHLDVYKRQVLLCYIVTFAIQRYQHAVQGTNLTVDHGYWLFPTFLATILVLQLLVNVKMEGGVAAVSKVVGANTFGIYMLHMIGLVLMSRLQVLPVFSCLGNMNSILVTLMNICLLYTSRCV